MMLPLEYRFPLVKKEMILQAWSRKFLAVFEGDYATGSVELKFRWEVLRLHPYPVRGEVTHPRVIITHKLIVLLNVAVAHEYKIFVSFPGFPVPVLRFWIHLLE